MTTMTTASTGTGSPNLWRCYSGANKLNPGFPQSPIGLEKRGRGFAAPGDWNSGDTLWLVDLVAPFGRQDDMLNELRGSALKGETLKFHRTTPDGKREVVELKGE